MKSKRLIVFVVPLLIVNLAMAQLPDIDFGPQPPKITNLAASKGIYDDDVHIFYDLANFQMTSLIEDCNVTLDFSNDGGSSWYSAVYSSFPDTVKPGRALYIRWTPAGYALSDNCKVRITARPIAAPLLLAQAESAKFSLVQETTPIPVISDVKAQQRKDASKLVDIYYDLSNDLEDPDYSYYIYLQVSTDAGGTFDANALIGVTGEVGAVQKSDYAKHIIWNPAVDLGAQTTVENCVVRVNAHGFAQADSDIFGIEASGSGTLEGTVYDAGTGQPMQNASVVVFKPTCPPQPQQWDIYPPDGTDENGRFSFTGLDAGEKMVVVLAMDPNGYWPAFITATIRESSTTFLNVAMSPVFQVVSGSSQIQSDGSPVVEYVRGKYCGPDKHAYYLKDISFQESFEVKIDWNNNPPQKINWLTPKRLYEQPCSSTKAARAFDMGDDILGDSDSFGKLKVKAIAENAQESSWYEINLDVIEPPPFIKQLVGFDMDIPYIPVPTGQGFEYRMLGLSGAEFEVEQKAVASKIAVFGEKLMKMAAKLRQKPQTEQEKKEAKKEEKKEEKERGGNISGSLSGIVNSDGKAEMFTIGWNASEKQMTRSGVKGQDGIKLPYAVTIKPTASVGFNFHWLSNNWQPGGTFTIGCDIMYGTPSIIVAVIPVGFVPVPIYFRAEVGLLLASSLSLIGWEPDWLANFQFEPLGKGFLGAGRAKVACVEGYLGGGFHSGLEFPPTGSDSWFEPYIILLGGVRVVLGPFSAGLPVRRYWPENPGETASMSIMSMVHIAQQQGSFELLPENYLYPETGSLGKIELKGGTEQPYPYWYGAAFPYPVPDVVRIRDLGSLTQDDMLAVWINDNDNPSRGPADRTELMYASYNSLRDDWTEPLPVVPNDLTADMNPQLISFGNGKAACIWQDARTRLYDDNDLSNFLSQMEIAAGIYQNGIWQINQVTKYANNWLDRSPTIAGTDENKLLAVWIRNENNDPWGKKANPADSNEALNDIMWSKYLGVTWSAETYKIASGQGTILGTALAYDGNKAAYIFCVDTNTADANDLSHQELYMARYYDANDYGSNNPWEPCIRLTNDNITDSAPRLAYDLNGDLLLFWVKGADIRVARGAGGILKPSDVDCSTEVVTPSEAMFTDDVLIEEDANSLKVGASMGSKDFDLVVDKRTGQKALVWADASLPYVSGLISQACIDPDCSIDPDCIDPNCIGPNCIDPCCVDPACIIDPNCTGSDCDDPDRSNPDLLDLGCLPAAYDIWVSYYEPTSMLWSLPRQLTWDDAVERFISGAFKPDGDLFCIYNKTQTDYNDSDPCAVFNIYGRDIKLEGKPEPSRSELYFMNYHMGVDLSVAVEDMEILPANPLPGTMAEIVATIRNLGEFPASGISADFLQIDPNILSIGLDPDYCTSDPNYCFTDPNYNYIESVCAPADFEPDSDVDMNDLAFFILHWLDDCGIWNGWCQGTDINKDHIVSFKDFEILSRYWLTVFEPANYVKFISSDQVTEPLRGGGQAQVSAQFEVPHVPPVPETYDVNDFWREVLVLVHSNGQQQDRDQSNNSARCETMRPDISAAEMNIQTAGPNDIVTVRVSNEGALKTNYVWVKLKLSLVNDLNDPSAVDAGTEQITELAAGAYYDIPFNISGTGQNYAIAVLDPNDSIDEFNEDNNIRSIRLNTGP